jgi:adenosylhomocysteine nucleosidase
MVIRCIKIWLLFIAFSSVILRAETADVLLAAATEAELQPVLARLGAPHSETRAAWKFWLGTLGDRKVVLTRTEGDPLNAVAATTLAIRHYAPRLVLIFGAARAHDPALRPGDVVISEKFAAFDGMETPVVPLGGGSAPLTWSKLPHALATAGEKETPTLFFPADAGALAVARSLAVARGRLVVGVLGSASQVNREADRLVWLHAEWGTSCEDGESAHIAGCAQLLGVPVFGIRIIDGADGEAAGLAVNFLEKWK